MAGPRPFRARAAKSTTRSMETILALPGAKSPPRQRFTKALSSLAAAQSCLLACVKAIVGAGRSSTLISSEQPLHINHVQPSAKFEADLFEMADRGKSKPRMQPDTDFVFRIDGGDDRVDPNVAC